MKAFAAFGYLVKLNARIGTHELQFGRLADRTDRPSARDRYPRRDPSWSDRPWPRRRSRCRWRCNRVRPPGTPCCWTSRSRTRTPGMKVSDSALQYSSAFDGLRRVDDDLVVLVDGVGAVAPQDPVQPAVGVAGGMPEREAGRRVVLLERLAHFKEAREVLRELLEAGLVGRRLAIGHVAADGRDGNAEPVVAVLAGCFRRASVHPPYFLPR